MPPLEPLLMYVLQGRITLQKTATILQAAIAGQADRTVAMQALTECEAFLAIDHGLLFEPPDPAKAAGDADAAALAKLAALTAR
jgi:hypothetical protein